MSARAIAIHGFEMSGERRANLEIKSECPALPTRDYKRDKDSQDVFCRRQLAIWLIQSVWTERHASTNFIPVLKFSWTFCPHRLDQLSVQWPFDDSRNTLPIFILIKNLWDQPSTLKKQWREIICLSFFNDQFYMGVLQLLKICNQMEDPCTSDEIKDTRVNYRMEDTRENGLK